MTSKNGNRRDRTFKAGALLCPKCCVEYKEVEVDFEYGNVVFPKIKILKCPACEEELFTPAQYEAIRERIEKIEDLAGIDAGKITVEKAFEILDKIRSEDRY